MRSQELYVAGREQARCFDNWDVSLGDSPVLGSVHTTTGKFENAAFFLRLGPPSTLIRNQNGAFRKCLQTGGIWKIKRKKNGAFFKICLRRNVAFAEILFDGFLDRLCRSKYRFYVHT